MKSTIIVSFILLTACSTPPEDYDPDYYAKRDIPRYRPTPPCSVYDQSEQGGNPYLICREPVVSDQDECTKRFGYGVCKSRPWMDSSLVKPPNGPEGDPRDTDNKAKN